MEDAKVRHVNKTIYLKDGTIWNKAKTIAKARGDSLSEVLIRFLAVYVEQNSTLANTINKNIEEHDAAGVYMTNRKEVNAKT